eukprot:m.205302 g.205302  ORF g.205302 m.205302 type:complete len:64 (-) comp32909_c6_seq6:36-227(-)
MAMWCVYRNTNPPHASTMMTWPVYLNTNTIFIKSVYLNTNTTAINDSTMVTVCVSQHQHHNHQ